MPEIESDLFPARASLTLSLSSLNIAQMCFYGKILHIWHLKEK